jgi:hypothetical protein
MTKSTMRYAWFIALALPIAGAIAWSARVHTPTRWYLQNLWRDARSTAEGAVGVAVNITETVVQGNWTNRFR